jgi:hypothetical protein
MKALQTFPFPLGRRASSQFILYALLEQQEGRENHGLLGRHGQQASLEQ